MDTALYFKNINILLSIVSSSKEDYDPCDKSICSNWAVFFAKYVGGLYFKTTYHMICESDLVDYYNNDDGLALPIIISEVLKYGNGREGKGIEIQNFKFGFKQLEFIFPEMVTFIRMHHSPVELFGFMERFLQHSLIQRPPVYLVKELGWYHYYPNNYKIVGRVLTRIGLMKNLMDWKSFVFIINYINQSTGINKNTITDILSDAISLGVEGGWVYDIFHNRCTD
jgi:hypothetical protein